MKELSRSIIGASIIIALAIIFGIVYYAETMPKNRFTPLGDGWYVDQKTGLTHNAIFEYQKQ